MGGQRRKRRVIVIGAGPAGSAAALRLTRFRSVEVVLLDRATFPRTKVCGSGLSPWALDQLDRIGVGASVRAQAHPIRAAIIGADAYAVELRGSLQAAVLLRSSFDTLLAREARTRGSILRDGTQALEIVRHNGRVSGVVTSDGSIEADAVVVCGGANGRIARVHRPGLTLHAMLGWYDDVEGLGDAVELYFDRAVRPHYGWVFPEGGRRANIGICFIARAGGPNARERFDEFVDQRLRRRLRHATQMGKLVGHPIATSHSPTALAQSGVLVAGEAARLVDPATAEGIHHALASGTLAGEVLGSTLEAGLDADMTSLARYSAMVHQQLGPRLAAGRLLLAFFRTPVFDLSLRLGGSGPVKAALTRALASA